MTSGEASNLAKKQALAATLGRLQSRPKYPEFTPRADGSNSLASLAQERLWILDQMGAGSAYNVAVALAASAPIDSKLLELSIRDIVNRHEILRATFESNDSGEVVQIIGRDNPKVLLHRLELTTEEAHCQVSNLCKTYCDTKWTYRSIFVPGPCFALFLPVAIAVNGR